MRKIVSLLISSALLAASLISLSLPSASADTTLTTCTNLETGKTLVLRITNAECRSHLGSALWVQEQSDTASRTGDGYANMTVCSSKNPLSTYRLIKDVCPKFQVSTNYWRTVAAPATPIIEAASARGHDSAALFIKPATSAASAPVLYYLVTDMKSGLTSKVRPGNFGHLYLSGLSAESTYSFTIAAVSVDGTSAVSLATPSIKTATAPVVASNTSIAAPAFTLSSSSETKTVNTAATGFTINSTGGAIASFAISATPAGMSFSTSTGALTGTPTSIASATAYTITATNASGTATQTFTLTVTTLVYAVGDTGPGGGKIFYVANTPFACGPTRATTCKYLEAAPSGWNTGADPQVTWAQSTPVNYQTTAVNNVTSPETATATAIGWGYRNTRAIILQGNTATATSAAAISDSYTVTVAGVVYDDWYLPSKDELNQLYLQKTAVGGFVNDFYWSSSEGDASAAWVQRFNDGFQSLGAGKNSTRYVRPVRAF